MAEYLCSVCSQPTTPRLSIVGVTADCHEAPLLVKNEDRCAECGTLTEGLPEYRPITEQEERDLADKIEDDQKWDEVENKLE